MRFGRNIICVCVVVSVLCAVSAPTLSAEPQASVPQERNTFRYAVSLYDRGMYERAAELFASLAGVGTLAWDNGAVGAGDAFDTPANGLGALEVDFDGAIDAEALGYYVLCAVKMQTRGYTVLANTYILKYPYASLVPQIRFAHAAVCFDMGDYKGADSQLQPLSRRKLYHNQIPDYLFMRALSTLELGEEDAAARFTDVINYKRPHRYVLPAHYFLGYILYEQGNLSEAREHFSLATADPRFKSLAEHYLIECGGTVSQSATGTTATGTATSGTATTSTGTNVSSASTSTVAVPTNTTVATSIETATETATETAAENAAAGETAYLLILNSYNKGDFDDVEDRVLDFAESDSPNRYWLAKAFIVLGDSYAGQGDFDKALTTFESVRDGYNPAEPDDVKDELDLRIRRAQEMLDKK